MKKLITIILFVFSIQIFAGQYQVTKQKNVTLSKEQIEVENKKIEETVNNYINMSFKEYLSIFSEVKNSINIDKSNKVEENYIYRTFLELYSQMFNLIAENTKIEIKNIKYLSNTKVIVKCEIITPAFDNLNNLNEKEIEKKLTEKYDLNKLKNMNEKEMLSEFLTFSIDLMKKEFKKKPSYEITKKDIILERNGNNWKSKEYEKILRDTKIQK